MTGINPSCRLGMLLTAFPLAGGSSMGQPLYFLNQQHPHLTQSQPGVVVLDWVSHLPHTPSRTLGSLFLPSCSVSSVLSLSSLDKQLLMEQGGYGSIYAWGCCYFKQPEQNFCCSWAASAQVGVYLYGSLEGNFTCSLISLICFCPEAKAVMSVFFSFICVPALVVGQKGWGILEISKQITFFQYA